MRDRVGMWVACLAWSVALIVVHCSGKSTLAATPEQVNAAIIKGVTYLYAQQHGDNWELRPPNPPGLLPDGRTSEASFYGGRTAICTYALLAAGEKPKEKPKLAAAINWLLKADLRGTYAVAMRSQVWSLIEPSKERNAIRDADARFLLGSIVQQGEQAGFYGYSFGEFGGKHIEAAHRFGERPEDANFWIDRSNSQFGVLGVWALEQAGAEIPQKYWELVDQAWRDAQKGDGGWNYGNGDIDSAVVKPTMAAAGVATLFVTQDQILPTHPWSPCNGGVSDAAITKGLHYVEKHIHELLATDTYYGAYGVERIGAASGKKYLGSLDWFAVGSDYAIAHQGADGSFDGKWGGPVPETCFALLFLSRGRARVMINKLEYGVADSSDASTVANQAAPWNQRPRDAANLARWMGKQIETTLNWQSVNLAASAEQLHDAPILYIAGGAKLHFTDEDRQSLCRYVQQGGLIVGSADCGSAEFSRSFRDLGNALFPRYKFRTLPPTHLIFSEQFHADRIGSRPRIEAMSNGVRELMILLPDGDAGRAWQTDSYRTQPAAFELAANIFIYATDKKNLFYKVDPYVVVPDSSTPRHTIKVARIQTDGNWDPEPGGWQRLSAIFHNSFSTNLIVEPIRLGGGKLAGYAIAHLTGTGRLALPKPARDELVSFVSHGGTLIIDAAGGDAEFASSAELELMNDFDPSGAALSQPLPADAPLYSAYYKINEVHYREFAVRSLVGSFKKPRIFGIQIGNRLGVFFSREDISAGLVGEEIDGILGYEPETAARLMTNIIVCAAKLPPPANSTAAEPATP